MIRQNFFRDYNLGISSWGEAVWGVSWTRRMNRLDGLAGRVFGGLYVSVGTCVQR